MAQRINGLRLLQEIQNVQMKGYVIFKREKIQKGETIYLRKSGKLGIQFSK